MNKTEKESEQNIGGTNQNHLQQSNTTTESVADSSTNRNQNSVISGQPAISSPYIHLSTCYAGKVTYLLNKFEPSGNTNYTFVSFGCSEKNFECISGTSSIHASAIKCSCKKCNHQPTFAGMFRF